MTQLNCGPRLATYEERIEAMGYPAEILEALDAITFRDHDAGDDFVISTGRSKGESASKRLEGITGVEKASGSPEPQ